MATIPRYQQQVSVQGLPGVRFRPAVADTSGIAQGLQAVGGAMYEIAQAEQQKQERAQLLEADTALAAAEERVFHDPENGAYARTGRQAMESQDDIWQSWDDEVSQIQGRLPSRLQERFSLLAQDRRNTVTKAFNRHIQTEAGKYADAQLEGRMTAAERLAASNYTDPERIGREVNNALELLSQHHADKPPEWLAEERISLETRIRGGALEQMLARDPDAAEAEYEQHKERMTPEFRAKFESAVALTRKRQEQAAEKERVRLEKEQAERNARAASDLEIGVHRGHYGVAEIEMAYETGVISPSARVSLTKQADKITKDQAVEAQAFERIAAAISGGGLLDPEEKANRKAFDKLIQQSVGDYSSMDVVQRDGLAQAIVRTGIWPDSLKSHIRAGLQGDDASAIAAADMLARVEELSPQAAAKFDKRGDERALASMINNFRRAGMADSMAVEMARKAIFDKSDPTIKARRDEYKTVKKDNDSSLAALVDERGGWAFTFDPDIPPAMQAEFDGLAEAYYLKTGDEEVARTLAADDLFRVWGETTANGRRQLMKYAPERLYGLPSEVIEQQFRDETPEGAILIADADTSRTGTYAVGIPREDGLIDFLHDGDLMQRWVPDPQSFYEKENERLVRRAKKMREANQRDFAAEQLRRHHPEYADRRDAAFSNLREFMNAASQ